MSASGVGGNSMGAPSIDVKKDETTANAQIARQTIGVVKDTLDIPISQLGQGDKNTYARFKTTPKRPLLPMFRFVQLSRADSQKQPWRGTFEQFIESMDPKLQVKLMRQLSLPISRRDPSYEALRQAMEAFAEALHTLKELNQKIHLDGEDLKKRKMYLVVQSRGFVFELIRQIEKTAQGLQPGHLLRAPLLELTRRSLALVLKIDRKATLNQEKRQQEDKEIVKELALIKRLFGQATLEHPIFAANILIDELKRLFLVAYPGMNASMFLLMHRLDTSVSGTDLLLGKEMKKKTKTLFELIPDRLYKNEERCAFYIVTTMAQILLEEVEKRKLPLLIHLKIVMLLTSGFLEQVAHDLFRGIGVPEKEANFLKAAFMEEVIESLYLYRCNKTNDRSARDAIFNTLKNPWKKIVQDLLNSAPEDNEERVHIRRLMDAIEKEDSDGSLNETATGRDVDELVKEMKQLLSWLQLLEWQKADENAEAMKLTMMRQTA